MGTVQLSPPAAPFSRIKNPGGAITISTAGKVLVLPTGDSSKLPSFNEYALNSNRLTIAESPFGGLKGSEASDYGVGTVSVNSGDGIYLTDITGNNSGKILTAGKLKEVSSLTVDSSAKTITEEFIIANTNLYNSDSPTVIDSCDNESTKGTIITGTGTITLDTTNKAEGTGSFYFNGTATAAGTFIGSIQSVDVAIGTNKVFSFYLKSSHSGKFRFTARTVDGYYSWNGTINTVAGDWQKIVLSIATCPGHSGTSTTITSVEFGYYTESTLANAACNFLIDYVTMDTGDSTVIDSCDNARTIGAFSAGSGTITLDTTNKAEGTGSFYFNGTATAAGTLLGTILSADVAVGSNKFFSFYVKSSHSGKFRFTARTSDGYYSWSLAFNTVAGSWQKVILPILSCPNRSGTSTIVTYIETGYYADSTLANTVCSFWIDAVKMCVEKRATIEINVPDRLAPAGVVVSTYSSSAYAEVGRFNLDSGYNLCSYTTGNMKLADGKTFDSVYGSGLGRAIFSKNIGGAVGVGASGNMTYSTTKGTSNRIGLYFDLPPSDSDRTGVNKVQLKIVFNYADETTGGLAALSNSSSPQTTPTYDGSGQPTHPSVVYFDTAWHGYKYWMAYTPYPNGNDNLENPSIVASNDGASWEVPAGLTNPIYPEPVAGHNNDPTLVYDPVADTLLCYWLDCRRAAECAGYEAEPWYNHQYLMMESSSDGITWSAPVTVIDWDLGAGAWFALSPVVLKLGPSSWRLYYVRESNHTIYYHESTDGLTWGSPTLSYFYPELWHVDIKYIPELEEYWGSFCTYGVGADEYFIKSSDGITWTQFNRKLILHSYVTGTFDLTMYRPTFCYHADTDIIEIWYSAYNQTTAARRIGYKSISRSSLMSLLSVSPEKYGATSFDFDDSTNASYGLQNMSKPWIALYDPAKSLIDFYLFTHRPKALTSKKNDSGEIYELILHPGNGSIYHGQITYPNLAADTGGTLIPDCLKSTVQGSITSFLDSHGMII